VFSNFILDIPLGILLFLILIGFHSLTQYIFIPVISAEQYTIHLLSEFVKNPALIVGYLIPISVHMILCGCCIAIIFLIRGNIKLIDVFLVSALPALLYLISIYFESWINSWEPLTGLERKVLSRSNLIEYIFGDLTLYILNTAFLFMGGYFVWLVIRSLAR
jgi:hypothetical protein